MELFSKGDWKTVLKTFVQTNCVQVGAGFFFHVITELVSKTDWKDLLTTFVCVCCIQVGAVVCFLSITEVVSKPDRKNLFKLFTNIGYIQIGVGFTFLIVTELILQIDWKEFLKTFFGNSCIQVGAGFLFVLTVITSNTARRNLLLIFIQTNCVQFGAGFLFLVVIELASNTALQELIIQPDTELFSHLNDIWITGNTWTSFQVLFLRWIKRSTEYTAELRMIASSTEQYHRSATIVNVAASSAGLAGGVLSIAGLIAAAFTTDRSFILVGMGMTLGVVGGATKVIAYVTDNVTQKSKQKRVNEIVEQYTEETKYLTNELVLINRAIHFMIDDTEKDLVKYAFINASQSVACSVSCTSAVTLTVTRNTMGTFIALSGILSALTVMWDLCSIVKEARELYRGRRTEIARMIREIAQHMEDEIQYIENEISKCETNFNDLTTFLKEHGSHKSQINITDLLKNLFQNQNENQNQV
ncbi:uncharacterized protein LOC134345842 isoform X2 [Mobula hypostoma]|uniref:uncharacterized protein LOC134345842 isoform X2 n=1 Tax=Mobula hypostoma TaxID=723540 RepID=UPI002FC2F88B